jgi:hypothetical protein
MRVVRLLGALAGLALTACDHPHPAAPSASTDPRVQRSVLSAQEDEDLGSVSGAGQYDINGLIVTFSLHAEVEQNGKGEGEFTIYADEGGGLVVDFEGKVTCLAIDPVNHRAWIGGKIKENRSTDPDLLTDIHRKSRDIWFRVLDEPTGDRSTFVGFEGSAGFITSEEYCAGRPWPAGNARTWPVVSGGIMVRP